jgi:hypothetical protein
MDRHEMQQSNIYLGIYIIGYYFFWKNQGVTATRETSFFAILTVPLVYGLEITTCHCKGLLWVVCQA